MGLVFDRVSSSTFILMFEGAFFFRTKNNHTVSRPPVYSSWPLGCLGVSCSPNMTVCNNTLLECSGLACVRVSNDVVCDRESSTLLYVWFCLWAPFIEREIFTHLFACLFVLYSSLACVVLYTCPNVCDLLL